MDAAEVERNELANGSRSLYVECLIEQADRIKTMHTTVGHIKRALKFLETELHEAEIKMNFLAESLGKTTIAIPNHSMPDDDYNFKCDAVSDMPGTSSEQPRVTASQSWTRESLAATRAELPWIYPDDVTITNQNHLGDTHSNPETILEPLMFDF